MPRPPRVEAPGSTYHVVANGIAETGLVRDDYDRRALWMRLARATERHGWGCLAYCLMDTHLHIVLRTPVPNLAVGMKWLCGLYAQDYNARYRRRGHVFATRYYSTVVSTDEHLVASIVYVLLNPVRAGLVHRAEVWPWSSCAATIGLTDAPSFLDVRGVLELVDPEPASARTKLAAAVLERWAHERSHWPRSASA